MQLDTDHIRSGPTRNRQTRIPSQDEPGPDLIVLSITTLSLAEKSLLFSEERVFHSPTRLIPATPRLLTSSCLRDSSFGMAATAPSRIPSSRASSGRVDRASVPGTVACCESDADTGFVPGATSSGLDPSPGLADVDAKGLAASHSSRLSRV
jgi:hypothetical protein